MRAVVFEDTRRVGVEQVPDAVIEAPTDVVVRITSSAICGTDLHMYDGRVEQSRAWCSATSRSVSSNRWARPSRW